MVVSPAGIQLVAEENTVRIWPDHFSRNATFSFDLSENTTVTFAVYDLLGREVLHLEKNMADAGSQSIDFDGSQLPEGTYLYQLTAGGVVRKGKFMIVR